MRCRFHPPAQAALDDRKKRTQMVKHAFRHEPKAEDAAFPAESGTRRRNVGVHDDGFEAKGKQAATRDLQTRPGVPHESQMQKEFVFVRFLDCIKRREAEHGKPALNGVRQRLRQPGHCRIGGAVEPVHREPEGHAFDDR